MTLMKISYEHITLVSIGRSVGQFVMLGYAML